MGKMTGPSPPDGPQSPASDDAFCLERMLRTFEQCKKEVDADPVKGMSIASFVKAQKEMLKVLGALGKAFKVAFGDLIDKVKVLEDISLNGPYQYVNELLQEEFTKGNLPTKDKPLEKKHATSPIRALNRATHVCMMVCRLFEELLLHQSDPKMELSSILKQVYPGTLGRIHPWLVKKGVLFTMSLSPKKATFLQNIGADSATMAEKFPKLILATNAVCANVEKGFLENKVDFLHG